jgi:hypothetical protein
MDGAMPERIRTSTTGMIKYRALLLIDLSL